MDRIEPERGGKGERYGNIFLASSTHLLTFLFVWMQWWFSLDYFQVSADRKKKKKKENSGQAINILLSERMIMLLLVFVTSK